MMGRKDSLFEERPAFRLLKDKQNLIGAEIGVAGGANAAAMLEQLSIERLYLIDQYLPYRDLKYHGVWSRTDEPEKIKDSAIKNLSPWGNKIVWIFKLSEYAVSEITEQLDFVYIDGNHRYEYVKNDIELYLPKIKDGGVICGHDFNHEKGVTKAVRESFVDFGYLNWDWWFVKK